MLRRFKMLLPLLFAFVLTMLPFLLLEYTQLQRLKVQRERELYLWEQEANNYLQLFLSLWSYEFQLNRRMVVFRKHQGDLILSDENHESAFESELKKRLPVGLMPEIVYAARQDKKNGQLKMFSGDFFCRNRRRIFQNIFAAILAREPTNFSSTDPGDRYSEGALGKDITIEFLARFRRGKLSGVKLDGNNYLLFWDYLEDKNQKIIYFCFFPREKLSMDDSIRQVQKILSHRFPEVLSAMIPLEEADKKLKPIFENRVSPKQRAFIEDIVERTSADSTRSDLLPVGTMKAVQGQYLLREFVDYLMPYEILLVRSEKASFSSDFDAFIFCLRLAFFSLWGLVFVRVLITAMPLGFSIASWLTMIFMMIGVLPLVVLYIAGSFHLESSAFRQEQQSLKEIIRQFEDADVSGESIVSNYREFCRKLESRPSWNRALRQWDSSVWEKEVKSLRPLFETAGLSFSAVYIYPPPESGIPYLHYSFYKENSDRDKSLSGFYQNWVLKAYFKIAPETTMGKDYEMPFFSGEEGDQILRLFMGNRADSDLVDLGDQKQFFYQNYIIQDHKPRNWFFLRANVHESYARYLSERVSDWNNVFSNKFFALSRITYPDPEMLLPEKKKEDKKRNLIRARAQGLIELAAATRARLFRQTEHQIVVVYPCRKTGNFVLTALMDFRDMHMRVFDQEMLLAVALIFLCIPVFFVSRFIAGYLVVPLKQVEIGLKKVAEEDFSVPIRLNRNDEIGRLSDAFDKMVAGIIERQNLGRFVSAGLEKKIARETILSEERLEKSFGAVLCSDIRSFTTLSETYPVREIVKMLNDHLIKMSSVITGNGGMIEQFIGDAILAVFVADSEEKAARAAINAAIEMKRAHSSLINDRKKQGKFEYHIGIGIEAGKMISGTVRAGEKNEYVLLGHCRTQSEMLEGLSKLGRFSRIVCSDHVRSMLDEFRFARLSDNENWELVLKGQNK
ncbi:MAG: adenylate/guanylate cyclase domain-containing protein [Candidatus Rifleibacteriota bacterium]